MLTNATVTTMLPVKDMQRARQFYERCLGLRPQARGAEEAAWFMDTEGNCLCIPEDLS